MPNWCENNVTFFGDKKKIKELRAFIKNKKEKMLIDFNRIIRRPEELNIESGGYGDIGHALLYPNEKSNGLFSMPWTKEEAEERVSKFSEEDKKKCLEMGEKYHQNILKYGFKTWYEWSIMNWGTKWNACHGNMDNGTLVFDTAWSPPSPVLLKLSELFPEVTIMLDWNEEGGYAGYMEFLNGEVVTEEDREHPCSEDGQPDELTENQDAAKDNF